MAQLVAGGLSTRVYVCNMGGFDTHTLQVPATGSTTTGTHATLLGKIAEAVNAFQDDLQRLAVQDRVVGMTFSEFGRRIRSNSGSGTDHGSAAPLLVFGSKVNPIVHGANPVLPANAGVNDNIAMQYDFRSVYASILQDWFQVTPATLALLFGRSFPYVPVLRSGALATASAAEAAEFTVYPNPVRDGRTTVAYESNGGQVQVLVLDALGREVRRAVDRVLPRGPQQLALDLSGLAAGAYYCQVREAQRSGSRMLVIE